MSRIFQDNFPIDFSDFKDAAIIESEISEIGKNIKKQLENISGGLAKTNQTLNELSSIAGPTGLNFSFSTYKNIKNLQSENDSFCKLDPYFLNYRGFQEVLEIDTQLAHQIEFFFRSNHTKIPLKDIEGMDDNLISKIKKFFKYTE